MSGTPIPLPTFDSQPSMLAVDLSLGPGESKTSSALLCLLVHPHLTNALSVYVFDQTPFSSPAYFQFSKATAIRFSYKPSVGIPRSAAAPGKSLSVAGIHIWHRTLRVIGAGGFTPPFQVSW